MDRQGPSFSHKKKIEMTRRWLEIVMNETTARLKKCRRLTWRENNAHQQRTTPHGGFSESLRPWKSTSITGVSTSIPVNDNDDDDDNDDDAEDEDDGKDFIEGGMDDKRMRALRALLWPARADCTRRARISSSDMLAPKRPDDDMRARR